MYTVKFKKSNKMCNAQFFDTRFNEGLTFLRSEIKKQINKGVYIEYSLVNFFQVQLVYT